VTKRELIDALLAHPAPDDTPVVRDSCGELFVSVLSVAAVRRDVAHSGADGRSLYHLAGGSPGAVLTLTLD